MTMTFLPAILNKRTTSRLLTGFILLSSLLLAGGAFAEERNGNVYGLPPCVTTTGMQIDAVIKSSSG